MAGATVCNGATLTCSMGTAPASLVVTSQFIMMVNNMLVATVNDYSVANISTFGMCTSLSNPTVSSATAAASGVLTPCACVPAIAAPWSPGSMIRKVNSLAVLTESDTATCSYAGTVSITSAGQTIDNTGN